MKKQTKEQHKPFIRFKKRTVKCQDCGTFEFVRQFYYQSKVKGLPIQNNFFLCEKCAKARGLK